MVQWQINGKGPRKQARIFAQSISLAVLDEMIAREFPGIPKEQIQLHPGRDGIEGNGDHFILINLRS